MCLRTYSRAINHWSQWIDYWAVDWDNKDDTFHNEWQAYRTRNDPQTSKDAGHEYLEPGKYQIVVKVIDILGNDTTKTMWQGYVGRGATPGRCQRTSRACSRHEVTTAPCVPAIRKAVVEWREEKYAGATETGQGATQLLVQH